MDPKQYNKFRLSLVPASGFQSYQYRLIEFASTELINLIDFRFRATIDRNTPFEHAFDHLYWQAAGKNFRDRLEVDGDGTASANMRYAETVVQSTMEKLMHHVESTENVGHVFAENQLASCGVAVSVLISQSKDRDNWSTKAHCDAKLKTC
jgi:tryptophan 2,3-dioxygenase